MSREVKEETSWRKRGGKEKDSSNPFFLLHFSYHLHLSVG